MHTIVCQRGSGERGAEAMIPSATSRQAPSPHDTFAYKNRNKVQRM